MKDMSIREQSVARLIRAVVIAQMIALLWVGIAIANHDAPDFFAHVKLRSLLTPIGVLAILFLFKLDRRLAKLGSGIYFIIMSGIVSVFGTINAILEVDYWYDIPANLVTPLRKYMQTITPITLVIYVAALIIYIFFAVRALRAQKET